MKSLTAEITAHLNRMYEDFILADSNRHESYFLFKCAVISVVKDFMIVTIF